MNTGTAKAAIALGSNLGDRLGYIRAGIAGVLELPDTRLVAISSIIQTPALVVPGSPPQPAYLNAALLVETGLAPARLLAAILDIERLNGRDRGAVSAAGGPRWQSRTLDLDILFYDDLVLQEPSLTIPHPAMQARLFVLEPLAQIAPDWVHPVIGESVSRMLKRARG